MTIAGRHVPFVGRQQELATLSARLDAATQGQGSVVLIAGEPGIGKTRVLAELSERAAAAGWLTLAGRAYDGEGMPPYLPFEEALRDYARRCPLDRLRIQLGNGAAEVALLLPEVRARLTDLPASLPIAPEHERYRLFASVTDFVLAIAHATEQGLVLLLDDLHWADKPSLLLLLHLARRCAGVPLLVVGAYRTTDLSRAHPLAEVLAELRRERLAERLALGALSLDDTSALITALATASPTPELAAAIVRETEGNAFFVEEVVRQLLSEGRDVAATELTVGARELPEGVREVVGRRLSRLSAAANELLQWAAVLGDGATMPVLAAVTELGWAAFTGVLEECTGASLLREAAGGYSFTHALIRQTVIEELSLPRRQQMHLVAALAIERVQSSNLAVHTTMLANHYRLAGALADPNRALGYLQQAAAAASAVFAWEDAAGYLETAFELFLAQGQGTTAQACETLLTLGEVQNRAGEHTQALASFHQAATCARTLQAAEYFARAALGFPGQQSDAAYRALLEEAAAVLGTSHSSLRAAVLSRLAVVTYSVPDGTDVREKGRVIGEEAVTIARRIGDSRTLRYVLSNWINVLWFPEHLDLRRAIATELIRLGEDDGDREAELTGHWWQVIAAAELGDRIAFESELSSCERLSNELRQPFHRWLTLQPQSMRALFDGRFDESEQLAAESLRIGRTAPPGATTTSRIYHFQLFAIRLEQGRLTELEATCRIAAEQSLSTDRALLALLFCEVEQRGEARRTFEQLAEHGFVRQPGEPNVWAFLPPAARACALLGDARRAEILYELMTPFASRVIVTAFTAVCQGPGDYYLGLLATTLQRWDDADRHFIVALALARKLRDRPHEAHVLRAHGELLLTRRQRGDIPRARVMLAGALAMYDQLQMTYFAGKTRALLVHSGTAGTGTPPIYPDGLSERELEVLRLVAAGKSNREVAERLVISVNTVYQHMRSIFNKIGAANRTEAAAYALRQGLAE